MPKFLLVLIIIAVVLLVITTIMYFWGKKIEEKRIVQEQQIQAMSQLMTMLIIDKKKMRLRDAGLPDAVSKNAPWYSRNPKLPIVKAKVGPKMVNFICDITIFDDIPVKREIKASVSGLYITSIKGVRGKVEHKDKKKQSWSVRIANKLKNLQNKSSNMKKNQK